MATSELGNVAITYEAIGVALYKTGYTNPLIRCSKRIYHQARRAAEALAIPVVIDQTMEGVEWSIEWLNNTVHSNGA